MTTIIDPSGTPIPVYNRGGITIVEVTANGVTTGSATEVPAVSGHTVVLVTTTSSPTDQSAVRLPSGAEIGDVVELYHVNNDAHIIVFPPTGERLGFRTTDESFIMNAGENPGAGAMFRKTKSDRWDGVYGV